MNLEMAARLLGGLIAGIGGWRLADRIAVADHSGSMHWGMALALMLIGAIVTPYVFVRPLNWISNQLAPVSTTELIAGITGMLIGLTAGALLAMPLSMLPDMAGQLVPPVVALALAYLGTKVLIKRKDDLGALLTFSSMAAHQNPAPSERSGGKAAAKMSSVGLNPANDLMNPTVPKVVLDTSSIIDGRIADISQTGFIAGFMIIPRFVLNELQHIADSSDILRRNRGRRGLDILNKLQKESLAPIYIYDTDYEDTPQVDAKLVKMAKLLRCPIITQDFNLNRVAELQGVKVLNINELANAVKSVVLPGEEMSVKIIQEGKELGQGVGYLDDGTMVVVEGGRRWIGHEIEIIVTRVLQTVAGRMIFAHPRVE